MNTKPLPPSQSPGLGRVAAAVGDVLVLRRALAAGEREGALVALAGDTVVTVNGVAGQGVTTIDSKNPHSTNDRCGIYEIKSQSQSRDESNHVGEGGKGRTVGPGHPRYKAVGHDPRPWPSGMRGHSF